MTAEELNTWSSANQQYLMEMVKVIREQIEWHINSVDKNTKPDQSSSIDELTKLSESMIAPPAIDRLVNLFGLSNFERSLLLLSAGAELDTGFAELIATVQGDTVSVLPSFSIALAALSDPHWSAISPGGPLRYWRLIDINKNQLITRSSIKIDEHILHYLAGINDLHERLKEIAEPVYPEGYLVPSQRQLADQILQTLNGRKTDGLLPLLHFMGNDHKDKLTIASYINSRIGSQLHVISAYSIPVTNRDVTELARLWNREAILNNYALFLECSDMDFSDKPRMQSLMNFIEKVQGLIIINSDQWTPDLKRTKLIYNIEKPASEEQLLLWQEVSVDHKELELGKIVSQFNLSAHTIYTAGLDIFHHSSNGISKEDHSEQLREKLWKTCCTYTRPQVDELAQRIEPVASWNDLVLPDSQKTVLKEIAAQVKQRSKVYGDWGFRKKGSRGLGISTLFAGESGTGKTMASEVLANELKLDLFKIDLSKVVNKYIGETEKNLKKIFDAAEDGGAILLFDEADALFGKRSDVKDSHDRYSNIEVSYLLQRMEAYRGLAILTTNMKSALDKAFLRRIRFVVQFPFPDTTQRTEIWSKIFPDNTPTKDLDMEKLAKLNVAGGSIRNIALNAAFFAADEDVPVHMSHISRAVKTEYEKLEKSLSSIELKTWQ